MNAWSVLLGIIVTAILSYGFVPRLLDYVEARIRKQFDDNTERGRPRWAAGDILGYFECALFFVSFLWPGGVTLAAAWLLFKTAAKWKMWETNRNDATNVEGAVMYRLFLIGTAANLFAALIGAAIAHLP